MTANQTATHAWVTGPVTTKFAAGAVLIAAAATAAATVLTVEITRVHTDWAPYAEHIRPVWVMITIMLWTAGLVVCSVDRLEQFAELRATHLVRRDLVGLRDTVDQAVAIIARLETLHAEVEELGRTVTDAATAAAIIAHATGRPVYPVPDLRSRRHERA